MRTVAAFVLGIAVGVSALLMAQRPRTIELLTSLFPATKGEAPQIRAVPHYPSFCPADQTLPCK